MTIGSITFFVFLFLAFIVFYCCPVKARWGVLLMVSLAFCVCVAGWKALPMVVFASFMTWAGAICIDLIRRRCEKRLADEQSDSKRRAIQARSERCVKAVLLLSLILTVGLFATIKVIKVLDNMQLIYCYFRSDTMKLLAPLGMSYYILSLSGYVLDVYWKRYSAERNYFRILLFGVYFPRIVQGPISRYNKLGAEFKKELRYDRDKILFGLQLMLWGLGKKLVLADRINLFTSSIWSQKDPPGCIVLLAFMMDAFRLYMDFSGYMDIVKGVSEIFGVKLEENFNHPFFSMSVAEFWRRWHISLGAWFRDYVFMPVSMTRWMKKVTKQLKKNSHKHLSRMIKVSVPLLITWILTGLWHGTGANYLVWGLYYGILITVSELIAEPTDKFCSLIHLDRASISWRVFCMFRTFLFFTIGRMITVPGDLGKTFEYMQCIIMKNRIWCMFDESVFEYGLDYRQFNVLLIGAILVVIVSLLQEKGVPIREKIAKQPLLFRWAIYLVAIFTILIFGIYGPSYTPSNFAYMVY